MRGKITDIKWRRAKDNKYFGYFDTKEEAWECLQEIARRYRYSDKYTNTISALCEEYQGKGIMIYPVHLGKWLKEVFGLTVKYGRNDQPRKRKGMSISMDKDLWELYQQISNSGVGGKFSRSWYVNVILRHHMGLDIAELIVYFGEDIDRPVGVVFFMEDVEGKEECQAFYAGHLETATKKLIDSLCRDGELHGLEYVKTKCRALGYMAYGLTLEEE